MPRRSSANWRDRDIAEARSRATDRIVYVCESCGSVSASKSDCRHVTPYADGSYGYYLPRTPYRQVLERLGGPSPADD